jgi:hypothetical protein
MGSVYGARELPEGSGRVLAGERELRFTTDAMKGRIQELRNQYSIGYSAPPGAEGKFRRIKLTARDSGLKVRTREGYYAKPRVFTKETASGGFRSANKGVS